MLATEHEMKAWEEVMGLGRAAPVADEDATA